MVLVAVADGCNGGGPITPTGTSRPGEAFEVTGVVTNDQGGPVGGAYVTMATAQARPSVVTDASGAYKVDFKATPSFDPGTGQRFLARAEILADGYDEYWRTIDAAGPLVQNFRLHRIQRIAVGDSIVLLVTPDSGNCHVDFYGPCGRIRVSAPATGNVRVEAIPTQEGTVLPQLEVCCVAGNDRYGNPVTIPMTAGTELRVEVGQPSPGFGGSASIIVKTSFEPS
jgi:hypothetical protein